MSFPRDNDFRDLALFVDLRFYALTSSLRYPDACYLHMSRTAPNLAVLALLHVHLTLLDYVKYRSLGTTSGLTFQARVLHSQEDTSAEKGVFERCRDFCLDVSVGVHILLVVEQSSLESQSRGCAKTPVLAG